MVAPKIMKPFIAIASSLLLCSCADMYVTKSQVGGAVAGAPTDTKDFGSRVRMITANCGVGAYGPRAIYIRPFCIDTAKFIGDQAQTEGEMPIRKALAPVEFAEDLKEQLEKIAPTRILRPHEIAQVGWLVHGEFDIVDGGSPAGRCGNTALAEWTEGGGLPRLRAGPGGTAHRTRLTDVKSGVVVYEFDMYGGSQLQGRAGTVRASGLGRALHFDLQNAAERIYLTLSTNPYRYGARANVSLPE